MAINAAEVRTECVYRTSAPIAQIMTELVELDTLIQAERSTMKTLRWVALACLLGALTFIVVHIVFVIIGVVAGLAIFIYSVRRGKGLVSHSNRSQFLRDLLIVLKQDTSPKTPFRITLSLKGREKLISEAPWAARKKGKQQFLTDEWLSIEGRFLDGTDFAQTVTDVLRKRTYVNARSKRKTKMRTHFLIAMKLAYPPEVFGDARPVYQSLRNAIKIPPATRIKKILVTEKALNIKALVTSDLNLKQANIMLLLGAYRILNLSRRLASKGRGQ